MAAEKELSEESRACAIIITDIPFLCHIDMKKIFWYSNYSLSLLMVFFMSCGSPEKNNTTSSESKTATIDPIIHGMNQAVANEPDNLTYRIDRAKYLYEQEMYDQALQDVERALSIDSTDVALYHLKADIQLDYYQSREAIKTLEEVIDLYPDRIPTLLKLAEFHHVLTQYDQSIMVVNQVIGKSAQNAEAFFMLGMNFRALEEVEKAKASFQRAVELDADLADAWILLGNIYEEEKKPIAQQYYENAVNASPENIAGLHSLAFYLQNHDQVNEAIEIYSRINQLDSQYEDAYLNTGILYLTIDSLTQAKEHFNILKKINPANAFAYYYSGLAEELGGNLTAAKQGYETAIRLSPDYTKAKEALADLIKSEKG